MVEKVLDVIEQEFSHLRGSLILASREVGLCDVELESIQLGLLVRSLALVYGALFFGHLISPTSCQSVLILSSSLKMSLRRTDSI